MGILGPSGDEVSEPGSGQVSVHEPVLLAETLEVLALGPGLTVVDGTVGAGGHARAIAAAIGPDGFLVGLDRDAVILTRARLSLDEGVSDANPSSSATTDAGSPRQEGASASAGAAAPGARVRIRLFHSCFTRIRSVLDELGLPCCDRVLLDVGVSSLQLDDPERGFSFMRPGPLDMRMDKSASPTAEHFLRRVSERELERVLREYGEERHSRRIAGAIVAARSRRGGLRSTLELADAVVAALPRAARHQRIHPATRTFQAIRIAVNDELGRLERGLDAALDCLAPDGRLAVISFHSLEDRIVKRFVRERTEPVVRKPIRPSAAECRRNPRARSARLRCGVKLVEAS